MFQEKQVFLTVFLLYGIHIPFAPTVPLSAKAQSPPFQAVTSLLQRGLNLNDVVYHGIFVALKCYVSCINITIIFIESS